MSKGRCTVTDYKTCFDSDCGRRVLANMMTESKFFDVCHTPEEQAVQNFMKILLGKTGCYPVERKSSTGRIELFVSNLLNMSIEY